MLILSTTTKHCVKYTKMRFPDSHFPVKVLAASLCGKITDQRKPVFWHILRSEHGLFCPELLDILEKSMQF